MEELRGKAERRLAALQDQARLRTLQTPPAGCIDLTLNDYLGLRDDAEHQAVVASAIAGLPSGAGASRLLGGELPVFGAVERAFAAFKGAEASLYFASGYAANEALPAALALLGGVRIFSDALNHASIIDGIALAKLPKEQRVVYRHGDTAELEVWLKASDADVNLIVTESLFSMDGDVVDLVEMQRLAARYRGVLVVDEAHAILCAGEGGRGLAPVGGNVITVDTCGKAFAAQGAFVSGPRWLRDYLINTARPFIYSTAPSPWIAAALGATLARGEAALGPRRKRLAEIGAHVRGALKAMDFAIGASASHIVPVMCGTDAAALAMSARLAESGVHARAIRPPTVPEGTARVRLSLSAGMTDAHVERVIAAFRRVRDG